MVGSGAIVKCMIVSLFERLGVVEKAELCSVQDQNFSGPCLVRRYLTTALLSMTATATTSRHT